jgi:hypothetical protein
MTTFHILYSPTADILKLSKAFRAIGKIKQTLSNARFVVLETTKPVADILAIPGVVLAEEEVTLEVTPQVSTWHLQRLVTESLPLKQTYKPKNHGEGSTVYLVDSGVDVGHPEFARGTVIPLYPSSLDITDPSGHGTAMASLIGGWGLGVAPSATIRVVKIPMGTTISVAVLLEALDAILGDHAKTPGVKVVNCSWTVPKSLILDAKIAELESAGLVVVAAAGNTGVSADTLSPVGLDSVLGVAASDAFDRVIPWSTGQSSNWGPEVDVTAPGVGVTVADMATENFIETAGTSAAAAIASGVVAQFITDNPSLTADKIQELVIQSGNVDLLFRDETIYGTTPNVLLSSPVADGLVWGRPIGDTLATLQRGAAVTIGITPKAPIVSWSYGDVYTTDAVAPKRLNRVWEWITPYAHDTWLELTIAPPTDLPTGYYTLWVQGKDAYNAPYLGRFRIGVFTETSAELATVTVEHYIDQTDTLVVTPALCVSDDQCPKGQFCCEDARCHTDCSGI